MGRRVDKKVDSIQCISDLSPSGPIATSFDMTDVLIKIIILVKFDVSYLKCFQMHRGGSISVFPVGKSG